MFSVSNHEDLYHSNLVLMLTLMESFLLFRPFNRLPLGSFDSDVRAWPFLSGFFTMNIEKALLPAVHKNPTPAPAMTQRAKR